MLNDDVENVAEPPMPQDLEGEHEEAPQTGVAPETAPAAPIPAPTEQPPLPTTLQSFRQMGFQICWVKQLKAG